MMGDQHFISGAITGGLMCSALEIPLLYTPAVIGVVMFFALVPDVDCPGSTVTKSLPLIGTPISWFIRRLSHVVYMATKGPRDEDWEGTHRHLSHTIVFALIIGGGVYAGTVHFVGQHWALIFGGAAALGCWTHCLGDSLTEMGCPWLWPLPIAGETWYEIRTPSIIRFHTGSDTEKLIVRPLIYAGAFVAFPGVAVVVLPVVFDLGAHLVRGIASHG